MSDVQKLRAALEERRRILGPDERELLRVTEESYAWGGTAQEPKLGERSETAELHQDATKGGRQGNS